MAKKNHSKETYYGTSKIEGLTYLEFGGLDLRNSNKEIWDFKTDQDAYDLFMLARYAKEIIGYQDGKKALEKKDFDKFLELYEEEIHTKDFLNSILTWTALGLFKKKKLPLNFYELGFTLFGCIDAHEACQVILPNEVTVKEIQYSGNEISYLISELALRLHQEYKVSYSLSGVDSDLNKGLFFSKGVTLLYALKEPKELMNYLQTSKLAVFDYNFSLEGQQNQILGTGKKITYLSLEDVKRINKKTGSTIYVRKSDLIIDKELNRMRCYCLWGEESLIKEFLRETSKALESLSHKCSEKFLSTIISVSKDIENDYIDIDDLVI